MSRLPPTSKDSPTAKQRNITLAKGWTQERIGEVLGVARQRVAEWIIPNAETGNGSKPKDCRIKLSKERIGEVLGVAQQTLSRWLDIPNTRSGNASTPKDCRIKLSKEAPKP